MYVIIMGNYLDLKEKVWDTNRCSGCGGCVAVCPADALYFKKGEESIKPSSNGYCKEATDGVPCGACYDICPRIEGEMPESSSSREEYMAAKAGFEIPGKQSGGAVSAILYDSLERGIVDAVVTVTEDPWTLKPKSTVITSGEALISSAGSRYNWWVPLLAALKEAVIGKKCKNIAIVALPCAARAVEKLRKSDNELLGPFAKSIKYVIGLFCTESFDYEKLMEGKLKSELQINPLDIERMDVRGKLVVTLKNENISIPLKDIEDTIRPGCHICKDFDALYADISAGSVGSPEGYTTLIVRSDTGKLAVDRALESGRLVATDEADPAVVTKYRDKKQQK